MNQNEFQGAESKRDLQQELIRAGALRQLRHNDGSPGFVFAYDVAITNRFLASLKAQPAPTEAPNLEDFPVLMKDHNVRQLVNDLRDIAIQFHAAGQLRARISGAVGQFLDKHGLPKAPTEAQGDTLRSIGAQMANVMFNLKQQDGKDAPIYADLQAKWDAAVRVQPSGNTGELVQGEDSARLDAAHARLLAAVKVYSQGYMQDEAEDKEDCVCGAAQHAEAKEVFAAIAEVERASTPQPQEQP